MKHSIMHSCLIVMLFTIALSGWLLSGCGQSPSQENEELQDLGGQLDEQLRRLDESYEARRGELNRQWQRERATLIAQAADKVAPILMRDMIAIPGRNYRMGKYEVTQAQWEAVMGTNPSRFKGANNPVECVSWDDCQAFLERLNTASSVQKSGLTFRLPMEEEWEFACRAGATGNYCKLANGTEITESTLGLVAWFGGPFLAEKTHPVGQKTPNAFGLYDMHGNVAELTIYAVGRECFNRGGSWFSSARFCGSSFQDSCSLDDRHDYIGFRLCASGRAD